jgi:hypothetical protein
LLRDLAIGVHATAASLAFAAGAVLLITGRRAGRSRGFVVYYLSLVLMLVGLCVAIGLDWSHLHTGTRLVYLALAVVAAFMMGRAELARRLRRERSLAARRAFFGHVGFTLIALFDGLVIVAANRLGIPVGLIVAGAAVIAAIGFRVVATTKPTTASLTAVPDGAKS